MYLGVITWIETNQFEDGNYNALKVIALGGLLPSGSLGFATGFGIFEV